MNIQKNHCHHIPNHFQMEALHHHTIIIIISLPNPNLLLVDDVSSHCLKGQIY